MMQEHMERALVYGLGGIALLFYGFMAWKAGRVGIGNRLLRFGRKGYVERSTQPRRFAVFVCAYFAAGCALLAAAFWAWFQKL